MDEPFFPTHECQLPSFSRLLVRERRKVLKFWGETFYLRCHPPLSLPGEPRRFESFGDRCEKGDLVTVVLPFLSESFVLYRPHPFCPLPPQQLSFLL